MSGPGERSRYTDSLRAGRSGVRIPVRARFSAAVQPPIEWVPVLSPGLKRPGRDVDLPPPSSAEVKERVELYLYSTYGPSWPVLG